MAAVTIDYRGQWVASRKRATALRKALIRLLWDSIADDAMCSCEPGDVCPQCEAMQALGYKRWPGPKRAEKWLGRYAP
jgi:hypothetical protein